MHNKIIHTAIEATQEQILDEFKEENISLADAFRLYPNEELWDDLFGITTNKDLFEQRQYFGECNFSYDPTPRIMQGHLLDNISFDDQDVVLEVGGGTGSVAISFATRKVKKIISVDINPELTKVGEINYTLAREKLGNLNIPGLQLQSPIDFINKNALRLEEEIIDQTSKFFIARPFNIPYTEIFVNKIHTSCTCRNKRKVEIITYGWPDPFLEIMSNHYNRNWFQKNKTIRVGQMESTVWVNKHPLASR